MEYYGNICYGYNSQGVCTMSVPDFQWEEDQWVVYFYNETDDENGSAYVTKEEYEYYKHGDMFPRLK